MASVYHSFVTSVPRICPRCRPGWPCLGEHGILPPLDAGRGRRDWGGWRDAKSILGWGWPRDRRPDPSQRAKCHHL